MIKVLHIVGRMDAGGAETRLIELARHVDRKRLTFSFCELQEGKSMYTDTLSQIGFNTIKCPLSNNIITFSRRFSEILRRGRYDVIHCHVHHFSGLLLKIASKESIRTRIMHIRTTRDARNDSLYRVAYRSAMTRWVKRFATTIVANSRSGMESYLGSDWRNHSNARIIYGGIDTKPFSVKVNKCEITDEFGIPERSKIVIHVGNFRPAKNHEALINIAKKTIAISSSTYFLLVGSGTLFNHFKKAVDEAQVSHRVLLLGHRSDVPRLLLSSDCFLFPSKWEGLPGALLEALAAGLTVVASDIGPNREIAELSNKVRLIPLSEEDGFVRETLRALDGSAENRPTPCPLPDQFQAANCIKKTLKLYG